MSGATEASLRCQILGGRLCLLHSGKIYDVTDFAEKHPGGRELLEKHVGKDVTQVMKTDDIHKHSQAAYNILDRYYIGDYNYINGVTHRGKNGHKETNGHVNGHTNGHANGHKNGYTNGTVQKPPAVVQYDDMIDWSKPVFWQVGALGEKYDEWVHSPIDAPLRLFYNPVIEYLSTAYWWTILIYWVPLMCYCLYDAYTSFTTQKVIWNLIGTGGIQVTTSFLPIFLVLGFFGWTFYEYIVHRWLFHCRPPSSSKLLITLHFLFHGQHHKSPMDKCRLVFPVVPATLLASFVYMFYMSMCPRPVTHSFIAGTIIGYLFYDLTHYYLHHGSPSSTYFKDLKTYHVKHHFKTQNKGFGISSKLWDYPFNTLIR